jgi:signal transduction histidine kinase
MRSEDNRSDYFANCLDRLKAEPHLQWATRRTWTKEACAELSLPSPSKDAAEIVRLSAGDDKWEVRLVVAENLASFPDEMFHNLAGRLAVDVSAYVSRTTRNALARRTPVMRPTGRSRHKGLQQIIETIRKEYGIAAEKIAIDLANRQCDEFLLSVAHDVKTILTPIKENVKRLQGLSFSDAEQAAETVSRLRKGVEDLQSLTEAINDFSRQVTIRRTEENVVSMIKDAERIARENITARGGDCSGVMCCMTVNEDLRISVSRPLIVVTLTNIIKNAIEAHEARNGFIGASVVVGAMESEGILHIEVSDMGGPMDPAELAKLQEFIPGGSSKASGNGFGLPSAKRNIERHGGSLRLEDGGGIGLTVKIQIPM